MERMYKGSEPYCNVFIYADKRILDTPAPIIVLGSLSASSVDITVRVWVKTADYWNVLYDINEIVLYDI